MTDRVKGGNLTRVYWLFEEKLNMPIQRWQHRRNNNRNLTVVHEKNYAKFMRVVPDISQIDRDTILQSAQLPYQLIELTVLEKTKYTSTLSITIKQAEHRRWLPQLFFIVRCYHDAHVAEVLNFQHHMRLESKYPYPNPKMYQRNEKQQINAFFSEWLDFCLNLKCKFLAVTEPLQA